MSTEQNTSAIEIRLAHKSEATNLTALSRALIERGLPWGLETRARGYYDVREHAVHINHHLIEPETARQRP